MTKLENYQNLLGEIPSFLNKYLNLSSIERLKNIGYFFLNNFFSFFVLRLSSVVLSFRCPFFLFCIFFFKI